MAEAEKYHDSLSEDGTAVSNGTGDESHHLLENGDCGKDHTATKRHPGYTTLIVLTILNVLLFATSITLLWNVRRQTEQPQMNSKLRQVSSWTPMMDRIELRSEVKRLNGTLFQPKDMSVARQKPSKESDAIWHEWELTRPFIISSDDIRRLGKNVSTAVKLDDAVYGHGDDAYVGILDVFHQMHCLNLLRQMIFPDYYYTTKHGHEYPEWREAHLTHCVDILMQSIQCSGNLNMVTMHWVETQEWPWPDFSIDRQCYDFEQLTEWRRENALDLDKHEPAMIRKPEYTARPAPDKLYELYNWTNPNHVDGANPGNDFLY